MGWQSIFSIFFILVVIGLLVFYWIIPFDTIEFGVKSGNYNFSLGGETRDIQFYPNMRFPTSEISYKIDDCPLQKKEDMEGAFKIISNETILDFYSVGQNEEIFVTCDSRDKIEGGLFIAGEGGPTNITQAGEFSVIFHGKILLMKDSTCERPNIAIHELLHVLGFEHSSNKNNIMYNISKCKQIIGEDTLELIDELYSVPSYPDLVFEDVSAVMSGRYLDINMSIRNNGLKDAEGAKIIIYADDKQVEEIDFDSMGIGFGRAITLKNIWVSKISIDELKFVIDYNFNELDKENNVVLLEMKK